jgi:hypothetical protein
VFFKNNIWQQPVHSAEAVDEMGLRFVELANSLDVIPEFRSVHYVKCSVGYVIIKIAKNEGL